MKLALFDLDHTLLPLDSDHTWGVFTTEMGWTDPAVFSQRNDEFYAHYQAGTLDIHDYVRFATRAARERGAAEAAHSGACSGSPRAAGRTLCLVRGLPATSPIRSATAERARSRRASRASIAKVPRTARACPFTTARSTTRSWTGSRTSRSRRATPHARAGRRSASSSWTRTIAPPA